VTTRKNIFWLPLLLAACAAPPEPISETQPHLGIRWVRDSAEYVAVARQTFRAAQTALPAMVADKNWSALPYQENASQLPPAVILDIDQTTLTNPIFQAQLEPPFTEEKLNDWSPASSHMQSRPGNTTLPCFLLPTGNARRIRQVMIRVHKSKS
jgi:acid phosphatase